MDIDHPPRKGLEEDACQKAHEAGEDDDIGVMGLQDVQDGRVEGGSVAETPVLYDDRRHVRGAGALERPRARHVRNHDRDRGIERLCRDRVEN